MENATKALLIAAAVLVAILIISLGLVVYNMAAETMGQVDLSGQAVTAHNEQFVRYNGTKRRGSEVNAMLKTVLTANTKAKSSGEDAKLVRVVSKNAAGVETQILGTASESITSSIDTSKLYNIEVIYDGPGGIVNTINVTVVP